MGPLGCTSAMLSVTPHGAWGPCQASRYSACCSSSPWAETAREERSGATPKAPPPPPSRMFTMLHLICSIPGPLVQHPPGLQRHCFGRTRKPSTCCGRGARACVPPTYRSARRNWRCRPCYTCPNQHGPSLSPLRHGCIPEWATRSVFPVQKRKGGFAHTLAYGAVVGPQSSRWTGSNHQGLRADRS